MTTSIVDIFNTYKNQADNTFDSVATEYANLDIEWVVKNGNQTISANTSWGSATPDTRNLLVLVKGNLTVDAGCTLTAAARKRGMFIYVNGDLDLNGIISMTARGASAAGQRLLLLDNGTAYEIPAVGGAGAPQTNSGGSNSGNFNGAAGTSGVATGACGGGGAGGACSEYGSSGKPKGGAGSTGTSYSGGIGGGAAVAYAGDMTAQPGASNGGAGGNAASHVHSSSAGGGAGNNGGTGAGSPVGETGIAGSGGLLVLFVTGTLTFGASGALVANGSNGGKGNNAARSAGAGGTGGGRIDYFYKELSGSATVTVNGGAGGVYTGGATCHATGGSGGAGSSRATEVSLPNLMAAVTSSNFFIFF